MTKGPRHMPSPNFQNPSPNFQNERPATATRGFNPRRVSTALIGAVALATALLTTGVASAAASSITSAGQPDFGPNVKIFDPSHAAERDSGDPRRDRQGTSRQRDGHATLRVAVQAGHLRHEGRPCARHHGQPARLPGRLLHRGGRPRPVADRRRHQRPRRRLQPLPDAEQLHRAGQLLALAVEPDDQLAR